ncbi:MAG: DUF3656 domain-containing protein, partial [bacterium]
LGASGLQCGRVTRVAQGKFEVNLSRRLLVYERIRVQPDSGDEGPVFTVTKMDVNGKSAFRVEKGQFATIYFDKPVTRNSIVYKVGISNPDLSPRIAKLAPARAAVDLAVAADSKGLTVTFSGAMLPAWHYPLELGEAIQHPLVPETLETEFASTRSERLVAGRITATVTGRLFLPATSLKDARRAFWEWLEAQPGLDTLKPGKQGLARFKALMTSLTFPEPARITISVLAPTGAASPVHANFTVKTLAEAGHGTWEVILPDFCSELDLPAVREKIRVLISQGVKRFRVTSVYGFTLLGKAQGIAIITSFPLPACNSLAVRELLNCGATRVQAWIELDSVALNAMLARARSVVELYTFGRPAILTTRAVPAMFGIMTDGRGLKFEVEKAEKGLTRIYSLQAFQIPAPADVSTFMDCSRAKPGAVSTSKFNYEQDWK